MILARFKAVLDANVLFPLTVRDMLLRAAETGLYQLYWSEAILDEMSRNLVAKTSMTKNQATRLRSAMSDAFPEAMVTGHEPLIDSMPNDEKDRHVAAAAVKAGAEVIVTGNLKDFKELPEGVEAQSADEFLCYLFDLDPDALLRIVREAAADLKKPPITFDEFLLGLQKAVPVFVGHIRNA